jgi:TolA-binding protein
MLGESLLAQGKAAEAAQAFAQALADPMGLSSAELRDAAYLRAAEAAARQEKWDESLAIAERFLAAAPQSPLAPEGRYAAAWARQNLGKLDEALAGYRAVAEGPRTEIACRARLMEGEVLFEKEQHKEAIKAFFKAAYGFGEQQAPPAFHPWQAQATFEAARCFEVLEQPDQARKLYAELVARYPDSQHTPAARKRLEALGPGGGTAP